MQYSAHSYYHVSGFLNQRVPLLHERDGAEPYFEWVLALMGDRKAYGLSSSFEAPISVQKEHRGRAVLLYASCVISHIRWCTATSNLSAAKPLPGTTISARPDCYFTIR